MKLGKQINPTLSGRLVRWLASLSLGVLGCLCLGVFFSVKINLESQQDLRLEKLSTAIQHLFEETPAHLQPGTLEHDLEDHRCRAGCNSHWQSIGCTEHPDSRKRLVTKHCCDQTKKHAADHNDQHKDQRYLQTVDKGC